jgi:hypothetical protein
MGRDQSAGNPGCNVTGISTKSLDLGSKWVELHELLPAAKRFAVLANIANADSARSPVTRHVYFDAVRVSVTSPGCGAEIRGRYRTRTICRLSRRSATRG